MEPFDHREGVRRVETWLDEDNVDSSRRFFQDEMKIKQEKQKKERKKRKLKKKMNQ